jgi:hypothetical protein
MGGRLGAQTRPLPRNILGAAIMKKVMSGYPSAHANTPVSGKNCAGPIATLSAP